MELFFSLHASFTLHLVIEAQKEATTGMSVTLKSDVIKVGDPHPGGQASTWVSWL
jgi:hypothetical protein